MTLAAVTEIDSAANLMINGDKGGWGGVGWATGGVVSGLVTGE